MPLNFPSNPSVNQQSTQNGRTFSWTGYAWELVASGGGGGEDTLLRSLFVPPAPTSVTASAGNAQATVSWTAPTGVISQAPITDYTVQYSSNSGSTWTTFTRTASTATSATVTGLTNGTAYQFRVAAVNSVGTGSYSTASSAVTVGAPTDPYFSNVSLLLHADGSGSTFVDSSPTPKTIAATNATQSATQSKWGGKSAYFDGSGDWLSVDNTASLNLSGVDWVIEGWVYPTSSPQYGAIVAKRSGSSPTSYQVNFNSQALLFYDGSNVITSSIQGQLNQWSHFAVSYQSGTVRLYWNGVLAGSGSSTVSEVDVPVTIGRHFSSLEEAFAGYIDDLRITKGSNRGYTGSTITVPTAAFPDAGPYTDPFMDKVSLLLHADGTGSTFVDSSLTPKTITANGNATQSAPAKFGSKSAEFDGSGDYLTIPASTGNFGSADFVVEMNVYRNGSQATFNGLIGWNTDSGNGLYFGVGNANQLRVVWNNAVQILASIPIPDAQWTHIALVRNGGTVTAYQEGASVGSASISGAMPYEGVDGAIGRLFAGVNNYHWNGRIDELRVTVGSNRSYTGSTITVPTAAFPDA